MRTDFAVIERIRARHLEDVEQNDFQGPARRAHEDRAELLAILSLLSRTMRSAQVGESRGL